MPAHQEGVSGLYFGWDSDESGIKNQLDANWQKVGTLLQISVISRVLTAPPGSPANGDCYIPATGATGVWTGKVGQLAVYRSELTAWEFYAPKNGWQAVIVNEGTWGTLSTYKSGAWSPGMAMT
jgi:hypothetical protein